MSTIRFGASVSSSAAALADYILDQIEAARDVPGLAGSRITFVGRVPVPSDFRAYLAPALPEGVEIVVCDSTSLAVRLPHPQKQGV